MIPALVEARFTELHTNSVSASACGIDESNAIDNGFKSDKMRLLVARKKNLLKIFDRQLTTVLKLL